MTGRNWIGEAVAAFDQSLDAIRDGEWGTPEFWAARATAAATIASAEQAKIANLIAWKQLQAARAATADQGVGLVPLGGGDAITDEIEQALGLDSPTPTVQIAADARIAAARAMLEDFVDDPARDSDDLRAILAGPLAEEAP